MSPVHVSKLLQLFPTPSKQYLRTMTNRGVTFAFANVQAVPTRAHRPLVRWEGGDEHGGAVWGAVTPTGAG